MDKPNFKIKQKPVFTTRLSKDLPSCAQRIKFIKQCALHDSTFSPRGHIFFPHHWAAECPQEFIDLDHLPNYTVINSNTQHLVTWKQPSRKFHFGLFSIPTTRKIITPN